MRKIFVVLTALTVLSMLLVACGGGVTPAATTKPADTAVAPTAKPGAVDVRWFVGMGTGTDPVQVRAELEVVNQFNAKQDAINLILEIVPFDSAKDVLSTQIASGNGPDIIGPVGWGGSNAFNGQWLDISSQMTASGFDSSIFNPALVSMYETSEGQVGLPFAVYPSVIFYNTKLFDEAGLAYPPAKYGEKYKMPDGSEVEWSWDTLTAVSKLLTIDGAGLNTTEEGFNKEDIKQYGYTWQYETHPSYWGSFWASGSMVAADGKTAQAPDAWVAAWKWTYDAIWGDQPFIANGAVEGSQDYAGGNPFNSNKVAMTDQPFWYTCCMGDVKTWDAAAMPTYNGKVGGRIDADTFRIWKGTKNPEQAFEVLKYLVTDAVQILIVGSKDMKAAYGAIPALTSAQEAWRTEKAAAYPWVKNLDTVIAGLSYPDAPSAEGYMPNYNEAWTRGSTFANLLRNTAGLDLDKEIATYLADLTVIFGK
jgi:multiple sugar transport system substrate-binding protein